MDHIHLLHDISLRNPHSLALDVLKISFDHEITKFMHRQPLYRIRHCLTMYVSFIHEGIGKSLHLSLNRQLIEGRLKFKEWVFSYPEKLIKIGYIDREYVLSGAVWTQPDF